MFIVIYPRIGTPHIFNFQLSNGQLRTMCGKNITKENTLTTISGDAVFPGLCSSCSHQIDEMYQDDLKEDPRIARNSWQARLPYLRSHHYYEILGPAGLAYDLANRSWNTLNRAKGKRK
jgi:hypothetical protein